MHVHMRLLQIDEVFPTPDSIVSAEVLNQAYERHEEDVIQIWLIKTLSRKISLFLSYCSG